MKLLLVTMLLLGCCPTQAQFAEFDHPRLWLRADGMAAMRERMATDPLAAQVQQAVLAEAERILQVPTCRYDIPDGRRLLSQSRHALRNILHSAWAWRFTGDRRHLERTIAELNAASALKDWNPPHFLDTAEMATAVALGYDWTYDHLTAAQRATYEKAIRDKALRPATRLYESEVWWDRAINNWGQVCGSGIAIAAMAIQGRDEGLAKDLIRRGIDLVHRCEHFYEPDGAYPEGPGYWHYGTKYHVMLLAACETLNHPASIPRLFEQSGSSMIYLHGPNRLPFNYADGRATPAGISPAQAWIARYFNNALQRSDVRSVLKRCLNPGEHSLPFPSSPLTLLWLPAEPDADEPLPLHAAFRGEQAIATFRTSWQTDAVWLAIKGGTPGGGHSHMDVGSFCFDAHGMRWIHDLGGDDYNLPGYFRDQRFSYYRLQNRSHNTLEINGELQDPACEPCPLTGFRRGSNPFASFDLSNAYAHAAGQVVRSVEFDPESGATRIRDEISKPVGEIVWRIMTDAECTIRGERVVLQKQGRKITLRRLSPHGRWEVAAASPPLEIEADNAGYRTVSLTIAPQEQVTIEVEIRP